MALSRESGSSLARKHIFKSCQFLVLVRTRNVGAVKFLDAATASSQILYGPFLAQITLKGGSSANGEVFRVVISKESNEALELILGRCVEGFDSSAITKSDLANYIFQNMSKFFSESDVKNLRATHFDEKKMLGTILRTDTDLPENLKKAIRAYYGISEKEKKRTGRATVELSTVFSVDNSKSSD